MKWKSLKWKVCSMRLNRMVNDDVSDVFVHDDDDGDGADAFWSDVAGKESCFGYIVYVSGQIECLTEFQSDPMQISDFWPNMILEK